jgi:hypothetical protein
MNKKTIATALGVISAVFWFLPWVYIEFMGVNAYQSGSHIGGLAYLILLASLAYAALSWMELHVPRLIASGLSTGISGLYLIIAGASIAWGLIGLFVFSAVGAAMAFKDYKQTIPLEQKSES